MSKPTKQWALAAAIWVLGWMSLGILWDAAWEGRPSGGQLASDLDLFIQEFKDEVADRDQVEHIFGVGTDDNGLARLGSARAFAQIAPPTDIAGPGQYNSTAGAFAGTLLSTEEVGASVIDLGVGRFWIDTDGASTTTALDDRQLFAWDETSNTFLPVRTEALGGLGSNLLYNGSFEVTDGTGSTASVTLPSGWALSAPNPTISYTSPAGVSEGTGVAVNVIGTGATGGISQALVSLKASTPYVFRVRANPTTAGDRCNLHVTDGVTNVTDLSAIGTAVYETLEVTLTTTAGPATVTVELEADAITDVCRFDHAVAFEQNATVPQPGIQAIFTQDAVQDATIDDVFANNPFLTTPITIPGPGYVVLVDGHVTIAFGFGGISYARYRLTRDNCAGGAFSQVGTAGTQSNTNAASNDARADLLSTLPFSFVDTSPVVGGTCRYRVEVRVNSTGVVNPIDGGFQTGSQLRLLLVPTR